MQYLSDEMVPLYLEGICHPCQRVKGMSFTLPLHNNKCKKVCKWTSLYWRRKEYLQVAGGQACSTLAARLMTRTTSKTTKKTGDVNTEAKPL